MKKILIATDFSDCAANAMEYALALAQITKATLSVIHVVSPVGVLGNTADNAAFVMEYYQAMEKDLQNWVEQYTHQPAYAHLKVNFSCENGFLTDALLNYIEENNSDFLIMGTMGASGITTIMGSNASAVAAEIPIPTLLIPLNFSFKLQPQIAITTDFTANSLASNALFLSDFFAALEVTHISLVSILTDKAEKHSLAEEQALLNPLQNINAQFYYIRAADIIKGIDTYIEANETDMICSIKHEQGFWYNLFRGSRTKELVNQARRMMLVLHN